MNKLNLLHSMLSAICLVVLAWVAHTTAEALGRLERLHELNRVAKR